MWEFVKAKVTYVKGTFHNNETIIWARLQVAGGAAWVAFSGSDLSKIIENPKYLGLTMLAIGFITEYLRRRNADFTGADNKDTK